MAKGTAKKKNTQGGRPSGAKKTAAAKKTGAAKAVPKKKTAAAKAAPKKKTAAAGSSAQEKRTSAPVRQPEPSEVMKTVNAVMNYPEEKSVPIGKEILIWVVGAAAALMLVSCFIPQGVAGDVISTFFFGVFGFMAYVFPFVFFFGFLFYLKKRSRDPNTWRQLLGLALVFAFSCALVHLLFYDNIPVDSPMEFYRISSEDRIGGGLVGGTQVFIFSLAFGTVGAYVLTIAGLAISFILFTQKPIFTGMGLDEESARQRRLARDAARAEKRERDARVRRMQEEKRLEEERRLLEEKNRLAEEALARNRAQEAAMNAPAEVQPDPVEKALEAQRRIDISYMMNNKSDGRFRDLSDESALPDFLKKYTPGKAREAARKKTADRKMDTQTFAAFMEEEGSSLADSVSAIVEENKESEQLPVMHEAPGFDAEKYAADEPLAEPAFYNEEEDAEAEAPVSQAVPENEDKGAGRRRKAANRLSEEEMAAETALVKAAVGPLNPAPAEIASQDGPAEDKPDHGPLYPGERETYIPSLERLERAKARGGSLKEETEEKKRLLAELFASFGVDAAVGNVSIGPTVTRYEIYPGIGVKVSKITGLQDDIKLKLATADIRIEAPIPGTNAIGIEVPNSTNVIVPLREILEDEAYVRAKSRLTFAVGKDLGGKAVVFNIAKMPHLLIAGATGSGKSVCINTLIMSILYKARPDEVKMLMIDPKMVELKVYDNLPHLLIPVVTDAKKAAGALNWAVQEMMGRYQRFSSAGVRDLVGYNAWLDKKNAAIEEDNFIHGGDEGYKMKAPLERMAQIVIIVDELADLMMVAPKEVEEAICRLAQLARAAGIHLVIATQRPSVNVITGLIKANMPSRIALAVSSNVDSRTIIDMNGAEKLLGNGDMLFYPQGYSKPVRVQGAFVRDEEIASVMEFYKAMASDECVNTDEAREIEAMITKNVNNSKTAAAQEEEPGDERDEYLVKAGRFIIEKNKASIGMLQRNYKIGFNRAARIMDQLCEAGVVGPEEGTKPRKILMTLSEFDAAFDQGGIGGQFIEVPDEVTPFDEF